MKAARTVLMAKIVTPKARPRRRTQAIWKMRPAAPERIRRAPMATRRHSPDVCVSS